MFSKSELLAISNGMRMASTSLGKKTSKLYREISQKASRIMDKEFSKEYCCDSEWCDCDQGIALKDI